MEEHKEKQQSRGNGSSGKGKRSFRKNRPRRKPQKPSVVIDCAICGKPIDSITQAIGGPGTADVSHFDCILKQVEEQEHLVSGQKVTYIGNGTFAIVQYEKKNFTGKFSILKRIQIETKEATERIKKVVDEQKHAIDISKNRGGR